MILKILLDFSKYKFKKKKFLKEELSITINKNKIDS